MASNVVEIDQPEATVASLSDLGAEEAVVNAAKRGDGRAFEILVRFHGPRILALALRYTRVREDAEDVVQQSFQKAFVHLHKFEGKSSFSTWLTRIAINEALMLLRRGRSLREVPMDDSSSDEAARTGLEIADASPDAEACYLEQEWARILFEAMHTLRPGTRATIELRDLNELSAQETARRMGLSVSAVKARIFHGRRKLREILRRYMRSPRMSQSGISAFTGNATRISGSLGLQYTSARLARKQALMDTLLSRSTNVLRRRKGTTKRDGVGGCTNKKVEGCDGLSRVSQSSWSDSSLRHRSWASGSTSTPRKNSPESDQLGRDLTRLPRCRGSLAKSDCACKSCPVCKHSSRVP